MSDKTTVNNNDYLFT